MEKQISEEFAKELLKDTYGNYWHPDDLLNHWKIQGYIKQSKEDEIRERLEYIEKVSPTTISESKYCYEYINLQSDLIDLLDNKDK